MTPEGEEADPKTAGERPSVDAGTPVPAPHELETLPPVFETMLEVERQRIDSFNRRTEVAKHAIDANDASDKRQFDYQMAKLKSEDEAGKRRDLSARWIIGIIGAAGLLTGGLLLFMAFFGSAEQSGIALSILKYLTAGGAGYGIIAGLSNAIRRMMR